MAVLMSGDSCRTLPSPITNWHCPPECGAYARRLVDAGWTYGSLASSMGESPPEPDVPQGADVAALLDDAEDIVNAVVPDALAEVEARHGRQGRASGGSGAWWQRWRRRR